MGKSGSEVSHFIPEPRNFYEVTKLLDEINKPRIKTTLKEIKNIINNHNFVFQYPNEGETITTCMYVYKAKIKSYGSIEKLK